ncbi:MAG: anaerobic glycerol-3-phosphate dehydrogenase subunit A [Desulfobacterales bacterium CG23_combo_of_CG06-09_8_20_14_all_51_8]|nr:MAG: anaerobic glycerol-3-phosphate dehydrogenase subunit A [Desulfobacterales bacterium CG23_combo_of_CG06-09_8_20_14_all_51_8]
MKKNLKTQALIIGGGATGTGVARDLSLRGVKCILVEKNDINAGASGANHGLLHSGARYVSNDPESAKECRDENRLLKHMAPDCIEETGGLFVAVEGDNEKFIADFQGFCDSSGLFCRPMDVAEARAAEPALSDKIIAAYAVEDASVDPFKLVLENITDAQKLGCKFLRHLKVIAFHQKGGRIESVDLIEKITRERVSIEADIIVNATGAWAGQVAALAGAAISLIYSKGTLLITHSRITQRVINRLRPPGDADILVPGGTVSIIGTTSLRMESLDEITPTIAEVDRIVAEGACMMPVLETARYIRAYSGVRPLLGGGGKGDDRSVTRGFDLVDHARDGIDNFITITGGKLTTFRLMAEKTSDMVCSRLGVSAPCLTRRIPLISSHETRWAVPGFSPKSWFSAHERDDLLLCECEMVPQSAIEEIVGYFDIFNKQADLKGIGKRSRIGKGSCQGNFCSLRIAAYLYDRDHLRSDQGASEIRSFINERWKGQRCLLWDTPVIQAELQEAMHCGFFSLELCPDASLHSQKETK